MKRLHRDDLFGWSEFNADRNIDFHSVLWTRPAGNVMVDPLALSAHDQRHLDELGGVRTIVVTNSDHLRDARRIASQYGAELCAPAAERDTLSSDCQRWLADGDEVVAGLRALTVHGSKTPGELALLLGGHTLITGDLVRAHTAGRLCLLPDAKLADPAAAHQSLQRLAALEGIEAVLTGDGWPVFRDGGARLRELAGRL